jgi:DNA primase
MSFIPFDELKENVSIEQAAQMLTLELKQNNGQLRGPCPTCGTGGERALVITPAKNVFYCFAEKKGGDQISLVAHIRGEALKDAAQFLTGSSTVPEAKVAKKTQKLQPLSLEHDHELVTAIGLDPETAESLGIGYCKKGVMKETVAIPLRDEDGQLLHYVGVDSPVTLPKALQYNENVVAFPKKTA